MSSEEPDDAVVEVLSTEAGTGLSQAIASLSPTATCLARLMGKARKYLHFHDTLEDTTDRTCKFGYFYPNWVTTLSLPGVCGIVTGRTDRATKNGLVIRVCSDKVIFHRPYTVNDGTTKLHVLGKTDVKHHPIWFKFTFGFKKIAECSILDPGHIPKRHSSWTHCFVNLNTGEVI